MTLKKKINVVALVILCSLGATALRADDITVARFPDADSVLVDSVTRVKYRPDGTYEQESENWTKILTEKGRREESSLALRYSKRYGAAEIVYVGAIDTNGVERAIDVTRTTSESTDNSSMSANIYDPLDRRVVCTIPDLKVGETVHTKTRSSESKARCAGVWSDMSVLEWSCPILRATVEVTAPKELPIRKKAILHPLGNVTESVRELADGSLVHTFVATNSPQAFPEPDMPSLWTEVQSLRLSTAETWEELSRWYWNLCQPHLAKTTSEMTNTVARLVEGLSDDEAKIRAVFKFVSQEIRYMGLTMEDTSPGYAPHDIDMTFNNRYGVCRDKAGLLVALLRLAGFEAYPVLIHVGDKVDPTVPRPFFNHAIVCVDRGAREYMLMDPTNENAKDLLPAYESDKSYLVARPDGETLRTTPTPDADHNALVVRSTARLSKDGSLVLENDISANGINDSVYREAFAKMTRDQRTKFFERIVRAVAPGAELVRCEVKPEDMLDTESPVRVALTSRLPECVVFGEKRSELGVPFVSRALGLANYLLRGNTALETRRYPLVLNATASVDETLEVDLDGALGEPNALPPDEITRGPYACSLTYVYRAGKLTARRRVAIRKVEFTPEEYATLRETVKRLEAAERKRPVFFEDRLADADVRVRVDSTEVDVLGPHAWVVTNTVEKEILTYKGKKSSAELNFDYNPTVTDLRLVSARVRNKNGATYEVSPKEMNVMDCAWAAAAPRYPASKMLIVNLPSVEIGSVISYTLARAVTNAPASFYGSFAFDSLLPTDRRLVRVNGWKREVTNPRRLPNEPGEPPMRLWRDHVVISSNDFARTCAEYRAADAAARASDEALESALDAIRRDEGVTDLSGTNGVVAIRNWVKKHVAEAGPGLWELPFKDQLTSPDVVLAERYGTRVDRIRALAALLNAAGHEADVVLAAADATDPDEIKRLDRVEKPSVDAFASALCRVRVRTGGCLGLFAATTTYFIGGENEYAPLGASAFANCGYLDLATGNFGTVRAPDGASDLADREALVRELDVRENGGVDMVVTKRLWGAAVGGFRKSYAEILPEDRNRHYQELLGAISQAATATGELETDLGSYPATRTFKCFVPDYATVSGDTITLELPALVSTIPTFTGKARRTPFGVGAADPEEETYVIRFPEGYDEIEHLPESFRFANPRDASASWLTSTVSTRRDRDGRLVVEIRREVAARPYTWFAPDFIELVRDRNRIAASRANRTIVIRRKSGN